MKPGPTAAPATTGTTVEYRVRFATGTKWRKRVRATETPPPPVAPPARPVAPVAPPPLVLVVPTPVSTPTAQPTPTPRVPKITLLLVLGHHFEQLVRSGAARDYAEIARRTGMTRARVTQIVNLTLLAPEIQEAILSLPPHGDCVVERGLRDLVATSEWPRQRDPWRRLRGCGD